MQEEDDDIFQSGINRLRAELFEGSPYAMRYIGRKDTVESLTRDDIASFARAYCVPGNIVIAVSGDVDTASLIDRMTTKFSDLRERPAPQIAPRTIRLNAIRRGQIEMDKEESLLLVGYVTTTVKDPDRYALEVLGSVLSGSSGRLFEELRNKMGLAYTLGCIQ
jgi:zinc protease